MTAAFVELLLIICLEWWKLLSALLLLKTDEILNGLMISFARVWNLKVEVLCSEMIESLSFCVCFASWIGSSAASPKRLVNSSDSFLLNCWLISVSKTSLPFGISISALLFASSPLIRFNFCASSMFVNQASMCFLRLKLISFYCLSMPICDFYAKRWSKSMISASASLSVLWREPPGSSLRTKSSVFFTLGCRRL